MTLSRNYRKEADGGLLTEEIRYRLILHLAPKSTWIPRVTRKSAITRERCKLSTKLGNSIRELMPDNQLVTSDPVLTTETTIGPVFEEINPQEVEDSG